MGEISEIVMWLAVLIPSVILHEVSHGFVARHFGDDTAARAGRLTLNPVPHIDPIGTVVLPALLAVSGAGVFGWAKPVPVRTDRLRDPRNHGLIVSLAGPATNVVIAVLAAVVLRALIPADGVGLSGVSTPVRVATMVGLVNVVLAAFNLLPIPPLDGSAVVERFLPAGWLRPWHQLRRWSMLIVLGLVFLVPGALNRVFAVALDAWALLL